jgi:hypothetical protein
MRRVLLGLRAALRLRTGARLGTIALAVGGSAVAAVLLLAVFGVSNVTGARQSVVTSRTPLADPQLPAANRTVVYYAEDEYDGKQIYTVRVVNGQTSASLVPPGIARLPALGEYYVSPALQNVLRQHAKDGVDPTILADRFKGRQIGVIAPAGLTDPGELAAYVGVTNPERQHGAPLAGWGTGASSSVLDRSHRIAVSIVALSVVLPILALSILSGMADTAGRRRRLETLRAVGYSARDLRRVVAAEVTLLVLVGTAVGIGLEQLLARLLNNRSWLPWQWWPAAAQPTVAQTVLAAVLLLACPITVATLLTRSAARSLPLAAAQLVTVRRRPSWLRLAPIGLGAAALVLVKSAANSLVTLAPATVLIALAIVFSVAPLNFIAADRVAANARSFVRLFSARRAQQSSSLAIRAAAAVAVSVFLAVAALLVVQHYDLQNSREERAVNASWPADTVEADQALHGDDLQALSAISGVKAPFVLRILQGTTLDKSTLITTALVDCAALAAYVGTGEFPGCDKGQALNVASSLTLGMVNPAVIEKVARGQQTYTAEFVDNNKLIDYPVQLHATSLVSSTRLSVMFAAIGVTLLIGQHDVSTTYLTRALKPYFFFRAAPHSDGLERVRTYFASKYGNAATVQTLHQKLDARRSNAVRFSNALNICVIFAIGVGLLAYAASTLEDLRRRRPVSAALVASGVPMKTISISTVVMSMLTLVPAVLLAGVVGALMGHQLIAAEADGGGTPYLRVMSIMAGTIAAALGITVLVTAATARGRTVSPSALAVE